MALEMAEKIGLTADQRRRTQAPFDEMQVNAAARLRGHEGSREAGAWEHRH